LHLLLAEAHVDHVLDDAPFPSVQVPFPAHDGPLILHHLPPLLHPSVKVPPPLHHLQGAPVAALIREAHVPQGAWRRPFGGRVVTPHLHVLDEVGDDLHLLVRRAAGTTP
jgi:hypothetical protein